MANKIPVAEISPIPVGEYAWKLPVSLEHFSQESRKFPDRIVGSGTPLITIKTNNCSKYFQILIHVEPF